MSEEEQNENEGGSEEITFIDHPVLGRFEIIRGVGTGSFGSVYLANHVESQLKIAIKIFNLIEEGDTEAEEFIQHEILVMSDIKHPLIPELYDSFTWNGHICILMEFIEGSNLLAYVNKYGPFHENEARKIFVELLDIIHYLHKNKHIVHRDIKCENVILDRYNNIHLVDFGLSDTLHPGHPLLTLPCGSPAYVPPEVASFRPYGFSFDLWSLGILLYAITVGELPFDNPNVSTIIRLVMTAEPVYPYTLSPRLVSLLQGMLDKDPTKRLTIQRIMTHPWVLVDTLGRKLKINEHILDQYRFMFDQEVYKNLPFLKETYEQLLNDEENKENTKDLILYKIAFKTHIVSEMMKLSYQLISPFRGSLPSAAIMKNMQQKEENIQEEFSKLKAEVKVHIRSSASENGLL